MQVTYKMGEIRRLIEESKNEFKAKKGNNVDSENKKGSGEAAKSAKKRAKDLNGELKDDIYDNPRDQKIEKLDGNHTMLDYNPDTVSPEYKKRVKAQAMGYNSELEMKNGIEKQGEYSKNEKIYNAFKDCGQKMHKNVETLKKSGLAASKMPAETFKKEEMYESVKTIRFNKTEFISEQHMLSKIPDDFKVEGKRFNMKDMKNNTYLVEWDGRKGVILGHENKQGLNESLEKMKHLMGYKPGSDKAPVLMENENKSMLNILDIVRGK